MGNSFSLVGGVALALALSVVFAFVGAIIVILMVKCLVALTDWWDNRRWDGRYEKSPWYRG